MEQQIAKTLLHGAEYNPEQWRERPDILEKDLILMKEAKINVVTVGVFSFAALEPKEGTYDFEWLDQIMDTMEKNQIKVILATPSAGKPPWLAKKYPNVMRTRKDRIQLSYGDRENQCNSNFVYREKVREIDERLAKRYGGHKALVAWHISNEMYGECHCKECQKKFRIWLQQKYHTLKILNQQYSSGFWSHTYQDWSEIESPSPMGEQCLPGLSLDYKRFYSDLSIEFMKMEIETVKKYTPQIPVTHNMFSFEAGIDYEKIASVLDVISWDCYPRWHSGPDFTTEWEQAVQASFYYDYARSLKKQPFLLMETTPSTATGFAVSKVKRPGMHKLSSLLAIASGADSVQYFQWRQSLAGIEQFHGAVVGHDGSDKTRTFQEVVSVGTMLQALSNVKGGRTNSKVALVYDMENQQALSLHCNLRRGEKGFGQMFLEHYEAFLKNYVSVDLISQKEELFDYDLVVIPTAFSYSIEFAKKVRDYVKGGGMIVMTFYSGVVNQNVLAYEGQTPYGLSDVLGIAAEEIDSLYDQEYNTFSYKNKQYKATRYCELIHLLSASALGSYEQEFYRGMPTITRNVFGEGVAYYIACHTEKEFLYEFYSNRIKERGIKKCVDSEWKKDVMVKEREAEGKRYLFAMNFSKESRNIKNKVLNGYDSYIWKQKI